MFTHDQLRLKVKHLTLAQEMRIIKRYEQSKRKWKKKQLSEQYILKESAGDSLAGVRKYVRVPNRGFDTAGRENLREHRLNLRPLARGIHLARGYLKGMPYRVMERLAFETPEWDIVWDHVVRFGKVDGKDVTERQKFLDWVEVIEPAVQRSNHPNQDYTANYSASRFVCGSLGWDRNTLLDPK